MNKFHLSALLVSGLLVTSCGPAATPSMNLNAAPLNSNSTAMNSNMAPATASGTTTNATTSAAGTFTAAEVATHNTEADCYAIVAGNVYDLTKWIGRHPGGPEAIMGTCGKDITSVTHPGGVPMGEQVEKVAQYKIGSLAQ